VRKPRNRRRDITVLRGYDWDGETTFGPFSGVEDRFDALTDDPIPRNRLTFVNGLPRLDGERQTDVQHSPYSILFTYNEGLGFPTKAAGDYSDEDGDKV